MSEHFDPYYTWLGIPPHEQPANHYRLLGISPFESNAEVISNAADRVMLHLRAFQSGQRSRESQQLLNEVATARVTLLDPAKKSAYDAALRTSLHQPPPAASPPVESLQVAPPLEAPAEAAIHIDIAAPPRASSAVSPAIRRSAARRRKPIPRVQIFALVAAALVALGGGIAFLLSRTSGLHSKPPGRAGGGEFAAQDTGPI